jgi:hypothetical protein
MVVGPSSLPIIATDEASFTVKLISDNFNLNPYKFLANSLYYNKLSNKYKHPIGEKK